MDVGGGKGRTRICMHKSRSAQKVGGAAGRETDKVKRKLREGD
jgi:hypothetical protein